MVVLAFGPSWSFPRAGVTQYPDNSLTDLPGRVPSVGGLGLDGFRRTVSHGRGMRVAGTRRSGAPRPNRRTRGGSQCPRHVKIAAVDRGSHLIDASFAGAGTRPSEDRADSGGAAGGRAGSCRPGRDWHSGQQWQAYPVGGAAAALWAGRRGYTRGARHPEPGESGGGRARSVPPAAA